MKQMKKVIAWILVLIMIFSVIPSNMVYAATTKMSKCKITLSKSTYNYTGSACKPSVTVKYKGKKLEKGKDFTISYTDNVNTGTATVVVKGKGKYAGTVKKKFKIKNVLSVKLSKNKFTYTGKKIKPAFTVKDGLKKLTEKDYTVTYKNNQNVGSAELIVKGKGKYKNKNSYMTFQILAASLNNATVVLSQDDFEYTGKACMPTVTVKNTDKTLVNGTDYTVVYSDNIDVGTATVSVTGKGNYTGTVKKTFTISIKTQEIQDSWISLSGTSFAYTGEEIKPTVAVKNADKTLVKGTDYTVTYSNNINAGTATVSVTGKGNYTGTIQKQFEIVNQVTVSISPMSKIINSGERFNISIINKPESFVLGSFSSEDTDVATVGWDGNTYEVIGNNSGKTRIVITINEQEYYCEVEVVKGDEPAGSGNAIEDRGYRVGEYTYGLEDEEFKNLEGEEVWTSSDETIAKIYDSTKDDGNKFINFIGSGKVTISVSKNDVTKSTTVTVYPALDGITCEATNSTYDSNKGSGTSFSYGQQAASVLGQTALETTSADELNNPNGFDYCKIGDTYYCFVADVYNNRVLCYMSKVSVVDALSGGSLVADTSTADTNDKMANPGTPAFVLGQPNFTSSTPGYGKNQMNWPMSVAVEKCDEERYRLYVADTDNHRILIFEDIASLTSGAAADYVLDCIEKGDGTKREIGWPWSVASIDVNGVQKFLVTSTEGSELGVFTSPLDGKWSDDIKPDLVYGFGDCTTPRTITWTGKQLLIGDENIPRNGGSQSGFHVFNEFPTSQDSTCFSFFGEVGYSEGAVINDKLYMVYAGGWNIFNKNEDGTYVEGEDSVPDLELHSVREANYRVNDEEEGYFLDAGGTQRVTYVKEDNTLVMVMLGKSAIYAWTNPSEQLTTLNTSAPDVYIGDVKYKEELRHVASDVQMHNPNVVSDGNHLVVHNDLDGMLYVYKDIPTSDGAVADYKYTLYNAAMDVTLCTKDDTSIMALTGNSNNSIYIWDDYKFDGALPNRVLRNRIGGMNLPEQNAILQYFRYDGTYSYLVITENGKQIMYVYEGLVDENSRYLVRIEGLGHFPYGMVSSNDEYVAVTVVQFDSDRMGVCLIDKSKVIEKATVENPLEINVNDNLDGVYEISRVHCGVTATEENDLEDNGVESEVCHYPGNKSEVNACMLNEILIKKWTNQDGKNYLNHEYVGFSLIGGCLLTNDGKFILADTGRNRVIVWNSVGAAIADQTKDYQNLTEDNANVVILGNGANRYDSEDMNGHTKYAAHNGIKAAYADTFRVPKTLAYDGNNLWIGEFKFSNRLLRYEMK